MRYSRSAAPQERSFGKPGTPNTEQTRRYVPARPWVPTCLSQQYDIQSAHTNTCPYAHGCRHLCGFGLIGLKGQAVREKRRPGRGHFAADRDSKGLRASLAEKGTQTPPIRTGKHPKPQDAHPAEPKKTRSALGPPWGPQRRVSCRGRAAPPRTVPGRGAMRCARPVHSVGRKGLGGPHGCR